MERAILRTVRKGLIYSIRARMKMRPSSMTTLEFHTFPAVNMQPSRTKVSVDKPELSSLNTQLTYSPRTCSNVQTEQRK